MLFLGNGVDSLTCLHKTPYSFHHPDLYLVSFEIQAFANNLKTIGV